MPGTPTSVCSWSLEAVHIGLKAEAAEQLLPSCDAPYSCTLNLREPQ
jgi:hypothetical protein